MDNMNAVMKEGDLVLVLVSKAECQSVVLRHGVVFENRSGRFSHSDIIGRRFGDRSVPGGSRAACGCWV
jgi:tRNA A58 N-methylase Trm61